MGADYLVYAPIWFHTLFCFGKNQK